MATTLLADMFDPEVLGDMTQATLPDAIRFAPLADVDTTLEGQPGSTLTVPSWNYIGDAQDVAEGAAIPYNKLTSGEKTMTIKKAGMGVELTDEAVLSGYGDPIGEGTRQLGLSIGNKIDNDFLAAMQADATQTYDASGLTVADLDSALAVFNDEDDAPVVLIANPKNAAELRADAAQNWLNGTELGANRIVNGTFGEILNTQVVRSRKLADGEAYLVKAGAMRLVRKRNTLVETARDIDRKLTKVNADQHYGVYVYNPALLVKINITATPEV